MVVELDYSVSSGPFSEWGFDQTRPGPGPELDNYVQLLYCFLIAKFTDILKLTNKTFNTRCLKSLLI